MYADLPSVSEVAAQAVSAGSELLLNAPTEDEDAKFRCLIALGTFAEAAGETKTLARDLGLDDVAETMRAQGGKVADAAADLKTVLSR